MGIRGKAVPIVALVLSVATAGLLVLWLAAGGGGTIQAVSLDGAGSTGSEMRATSPGIQSERLAVTPNSGSPLRGANQQSGIPEEYRIPEVKVGDTYADFLSKYWGGRWAEVEPLLINDESDRAFLATVIEEPPRYPTGTIEDWFRNLEERTIGIFRKTHELRFFSFPASGQSLQAPPSAIATSLTLSRRYNPQGKALDFNTRTSLTSFIEERVLDSLLHAQSAADRCEDLIREDIREVIQYRSARNGKVFFGPLLSNGAFTRPDVAVTDPYPVFDIFLTRTDRQTEPTDGGYINGILTLWCGIDPELAQDLDQLREENTILKATMEEFFAALP